MRPVRIVLLLVVLYSGCAELPDPKSAADVKPKGPEWRSNGKELVPYCEGWSGANTKRFEACRRQYLKRIVSTSHARQTPSPARRSDRVLAAR